MIRAGAVPLIWPARAADGRGSPKFARLKALNISHRKLSISAREREIAMDPDRH